MSAAKNTTVTERKPDPGQQWKCGGEFLPFHPQASHVPPEYRDGWNRCYWMAVARDARARDEATRPSMSMFATAADYNAAMDEWLAAGVPEVPAITESWLEYRQRDVREANGWGHWTRCSTADAEVVQAMSHWQVRRVGELSAGVPEVGAPSEDADGAPITPQRLIAWLDAKYARHGEEEDKWAADYIRAAAGVPEVEAPAGTRVNITGLFLDVCAAEEEYASWFPIRAAGVPAVEAPSFSDAIKAAEELAEGACDNGASLDWAESQIATIRAALGAKEDGRG